MPGKKETSARQTCVGRTIADGLSQRLHCGEGILQLCAYNGPKKQGHELLITASETCFHLDDSEAVALRGNSHPVLLKDRHI
jgi:hypothetical protein